MSERATEQLSIVLKNISHKNELIGVFSPLGIEFDSEELVNGLEEYQTGWIEPKMLDQLSLVLDGLLNRGLIEQIEHIERYRLDEFRVEDKYNLILPIDFSERMKSYLDSLSGDYAITDKNQRNTKLKLEYVKNEMYLVGDKAKKRVRISDDKNSLQARLFRHLFEPELALFKTIESTVEAMGDENIADGARRIKSRFKEIQSILSQANTKTRFKLVFKDKKVAMIIR